MHAGDYIEARGRIIRTGDTSRTMEFEAHKVIAARPDLSPSAADVLAEPVLVVRARGTCVTPAARRQRRRTDDRANGRQPAGGKRNVSDAGPVLGAPIRPPGELVRDCAPHSFR